MKNRATVSFILKTAFELLGVFPSTAEAITSKFEEKGDLKSLILAGTVRAVAVTLGRHEANDFFPKRDEDSDYQDLMVHVQQLRNRLRKLDNTLRTVPGTVEMRKVLDRADAVLGLALPVTHIHDRKGNILCVSTLPKIVEVQSVRLKKAAQWRGAEYNRPHLQEAFCLRCRCEAAPHG